MEEKLSLKQRLLKIINEVRIEKEGKNTFQNYEYFLLEGIFSRVNPLFEKYGILPLFTTYFEKFETEQIEEVGKITTKYDYREIAELRYVDAIGNDEDLVYHFTLKDIEIKGANKMQGAGGTRTYAKRYLYMESLNISDDKLDLDSDNMTDKIKGKPSANSAKVEEIIQKIRAKVAALKDAGASDKALCDAIKSVYSDGGSPSANYTTIKTVEEGNKIIKALDKI